MAENDVEQGMLAELDILVFLKLREEPDRAAERVFGALQSPYQPGVDEESGESYYEAHGLGFRASLFANQGTMLESEFEDYSYGLEITSQFWCADMDSVELEGPLSEYYARQLAFDLDVETATEVLLETTEDAEIFEIRSFRRNPQYRTDQSPLIPKVFVIETREIEEPFEEDDELEEVEDEL